MDTLSGAGNYVKRVASVWKVVYSKRKEFAPLGSKFFPFRVDSFSKGLGVQETKPEAT